MKKLAQVFLAGVMVVVPFAVTLYLVVAVGGWLGNLGRSLLPESEPAQENLFRLLGAGIVIAGIFLIGLLTKLWLFQWLVALFEKLFRRVPGIKTVYESVRDLLKLFGEETKQMGQAVLYSPPGSNADMLAIVTSDGPMGLSAEEEGQKVVIYLPLAYMIGGPILYVPAKHVRKIDLPVEQVLKLAATAHVGVSAPPKATGPAETSETAS